MPILFKSKFPQSTSKPMYYVDKTESVAVAPSKVIDFGVVDAKGRKVGISRAVNRMDVTLSEQEPAHGRGSRLHPADLPTTYYVGHAHPTRNGEVFGGSWVRFQAVTQEEAEAELDRRIERSRRLALKKFSA